MRSLILVIATAGGVAVLTANADETPTANLSPIERLMLEAIAKQRRVAGFALYKAGKYSEAGPHWEASLELSRRLYPTSDYPNGTLKLAVDLNNLAFFHKTQGKLAESESLYKDALEMWRRVHKRDHADTAVALNSLGMLYQSQKKYADAEPLLRECLDMRRRLFKGDHLDVALSLTNLGYQYRYQGKFKDAENLFKESLEMRKRLFKGDHQQVVKGLNDLGFYYERYGNYKEAAAIYTDKLDMQRRLTKGDHPDIAATLSSVGLMLNYSGKRSESAVAYKEALDMRRRLYKGDHYDIVVSLKDYAMTITEPKSIAESEKLLKEAIEMVDRIYKGDHLNVVLTLRALGAIYSSRSMYDKAEPIYTRMLEIRRRLIKGDHLDLAASLDDLARVCHYQSKYDLAESLYKEALEMRRRLIKGDHADLARSISNLAGIFKWEKKYRDAEALYKESLEMTRRLTKGDHPDVVKALDDLAKMYKDQGKFADAELVLTEARDMHKRVSKGNYPGDSAMIAGFNNSLGLQLQNAGAYGDAERLFRDSLAMRRRVYPGDHVDVFTSLNNLGLAYLGQGKYAEAEPLLKESLEMGKRLYKGDHSGIATTLSNLGLLHYRQGQYTSAEVLFKEALAIRTRLFKGDHADVAASLNDLAALYKSQGKYAESERVFKESLAIRQRLFKDDHADVALTLNNLGTLLAAQEKYADAEVMLKNALEMRKRLFKNNHSSVALSLANLGTVLEDQGRYAEAESYLREALEMQKKLFKGDNPSLVTTLTNLATLCHRHEKLEEAKELQTEALMMSQRLITEFAKEQSEGLTLTLIASRPLLRDAFLSIALQAKTPPLEIYPAIWASKGLATRVYEQRQQKARAAASNPQAVALLEELATARRRRAELLLAQQSADVAAQKKRETTLAAFDAQIKELDGKDGKLRSLLPSIARLEKLAVAQPTDLQKLLPGDIVMIDFLRYAHFEYDDKKPGKDGEKRTEQYAAFIVTKERIELVSLGPAAKIEKVVGQWREAITTPPFAVPADIPAQVRALIWEPVRKHIPNGTKIVYVSPDADLTRVPWAALPGDKVGSILLEDFAIATIPHGQFLLDTLQPPDSRDNPPVGLLAVGGVAFGDEPQSPKIGDTIASASPRGSVPLDAKQKLNWVELAGAKTEAEQVAMRATEHKLPSRVLSGPAASTDAVLAELPKVRYAHIATHGFFADKQFRSVLQLDPKDYLQSLSGERIGAGANSPMVMSGLVFAGANLPTTPGRGILTGEALIDRDLSGLELAVLSACETGLGDVAGGEGVYGLQRAFHVAGAKNVVASLWKVPDAATAALMGEFYRALWDEKLPAILALQKAQLAIYRADPKQFADMARRGPGLGDTDLDKTAKVIGKTPINQAGKNSPVVWAAFSLSGPGR